MADGIARTPAEELLRERFARSEIGAEEYERSLRVLRNERSGAGRRDEKRSKVVIAGLAAAALLTAGAAGVSYATGDEQGSGVGTMMSGGGMGSMTGSGGASAMQGMGQFSEDKPFDLQFIDQMTMHHEGAIMSAKSMIGDSKRPELRKLAENIDESQSEQIKQLQTWRDKWYPDAGQTSGMMGQMMGGDQMEKMMGGSMRGMMGGDATDEMFLEMMIPHHQMAVDMAEKALAEADHPELKDLAQKIEDEQSAEIELMKGYLDEIEAASKS